MSQATALILLAVALSACSEPLEYADWVLPLPEGTPTVEYAAVSDADRTATFATERDLVLAEAFGRPFFNPIKATVASDGTIFVLDAGNHRVVAFDADGTPLVEFGNEGQGPGEFANPADLVVLEDSIIVNDTRNVRFSVFERDGTHVVDHRLETRIRTLEMRERAGGLLALRWDFTEDDGPGGSGRLWTLARHRLSGEELGLPFRLQTPPSAHVATGVYEGSIPILAPGVFGTLSPDGVVYVTHSGQYQILSLTPEGTPRWALRTTYRPMAIEAEVRTKVTKELREQWRQVVGIDLSDDDIHFPEHYPAIISLMVDARGNLFVVPYANREHDEYRGTSRGPVPVDVYSPDADLLFSGMIGIETWEATLDDHVYRVETDPESEERVIARYRLVYPFD